MHFTMPASKVIRSAEELEEIQAEGHDWYAEGYEYGDGYVKNWAEGKIALGKPIEQQPQTALANKLWREGFNDRIAEHMNRILSRHGLYGGQTEVARWRSGIAKALDGDAAAAAS